jgi:hypothetical protein
MSGLTPTSVSRINASSKLALPTPSGLWMSPQFTSSAAATLGLGTLRLAPLVVPVQTVIQTVAVEVTTLAASGVFRVGVYGSDGNMQPADLVYESTTIDTSTIGIKTQAASFTLPPGVYWIGGISQVGDSAMRAGSAAVVPRPPCTGGSSPSASGSTAAGYNRASVATSGALPASAAGSWSMSGTIPFVWLRAA